MAVNTKKIDEIYQVIAMLSPEEQQVLLDRLGEDTILPIQLIEEVKKEHPDEWLEFEVTQLADNGFTPLEGRLVAHGKNPDEVADIAMAYYTKHDVKGTYSAYTGEIKAQAVLL